MQSADKGLWGKLSGWFSAEIQLCVISVAVEAETMVVDDRTKVQAQSLGARLG